MLMQKRPKVPTCLCKKGQKYPHAYADETLQPLIHTAYRGCKNPSKYLVST